MFLSRYDLYDIHSIIVAIRFKPNDAANAEIVRSVIDVLSTPQIGNVIEDNIVRKKIRTIESLDKGDSKMTNLICKLIFFSAFFGNF